MPSFTFQLRFVPFVSNFTKRQTIRAIRNHPARKGQLISHFTGPRFKPVRIIDKQVCTGVDSIFILEDGSVYIAPDQTITNEDAGTIIKFLTQDVVVINEEAVTQLNGIVLKKLCNEERDALAWQDGFRHTNNLKRKFNCFAVMFNWWKETHLLPFAGHLIKW